VVTQLDNEGFLAEMEALLEARFGDDWYFRYNVDDGYVEVHMFVPSGQDFTQGYTIHAQGGVVAL
jgi:hypothetical protein